MNFFAYACRTLAIIGASLGLVCFADRPVITIIYFLVSGTLWVVADEVK